MTLEVTAWTFLAGAALALLGGLFALYRSPLMEIYLSTWMIC